MKNIPLLLFIISSQLFISCSSREGPQWVSNEKKPKTYKIATRQVPPQPVYSGLRWVRPPEMTPSRKVEASDADIVMPILSYHIENKSLREVALVLAASSMYSSYCAASIADKKISISTIGTIEEIAESISEKAKIDVVIDHKNKEVRFLARNITEARMDTIK